MYRLCLALLAVAVLVTPAFGINRYPSQRRAHAHHTYRSHNRPYYYNYNYSNRDHWDHTRRDYFDSRYPQNRTPSVIVNPNYKPQPVSPPVIIVNPYCPCK